MSQLIALNARNADLTSLGIIALGATIGSFGFILEFRNIFPGVLLKWAGQAIIWIGVAYFVYVLVDQWRIATRRKPVKESQVSEVWFCPNCGNLDVRGADYCPGCGKPLPKFIAIKNGAWAPADSVDPHKVATRKDGKRV